MKSESKILNFGSFNIDEVYQLDTFLKPGETKSSTGYEIDCGGKGLNQSVAAAKAGSEVWHAGPIGEDGRFLVEKLEEFGVNTRFVKVLDARSGRAVIMVDAKGQNCIVLFPGTNALVTEEYVDYVFDSFPDGQAVMLQNELNCLPYIIHTAKRHGHRIFLNAAPMTDAVFACDLTELECLIVNEVEGKQLAGCDSDDAILPVLQERYPGLHILLTLGENGAIYSAGGEEWTIAARKVEVKDTTAAGDTFCGFFIHHLLRGDSAAVSLERATLASSVCVSRKGAADAIPTGEEVDELLGNDSGSVPKAHKGAV